MSDLTPRTEEEVSHMPTALGIPRRTRAKSREGMVVTTIALPEGLLNALQERAWKERKAMTLLVREIIQDALRARPRRRRGGAR
jgi:hypothetical protein